MAPIKHDGYRLLIEALDEALGRHGTPRIFNTDRDAQFISAAFTGKLKAGHHDFRWTDAVVSWTILLSTTVTLDQIRRSDVL